MSKRRSRGPLVVAALVVTLGAGCSGSPRVASGNLAEAKAKVIALVNATGESVGTRVTYVPAKSADELPCKKKLLGYAVGDVDARHAEVPVEVTVKGANGAGLLPLIEKFWRSKGYTIDRSGMSDKQFPKLRAHAGPDDLLIATGYTSFPRLNLYGVSACVKP